MQNLTAKTATTTTINNRHNEAIMNSLLTEVLQWLHNNDYRRASFDRIIGVVPSASTYDQLSTMVAQNDDVFRPTIIKGGLPGLAVQDFVNVSEALEMSRRQPEEEAAPTPVAVDSCRNPVIAAITPTSVTPEAIANEIESEHYRNLGGALKQTGPTANVTLCVFVLKNGFVIIGKSACVNSENFNEDLGRKLAREDAVRQMWPYLGFRLADARLFNGVAQAA